jgi:Tfp pilus assembly protein PilO
MNLDSKKQAIAIWAENHKKGIVVGMVLVLFISLLILIAGFFVKKPPQPNTLKKLKEATEKVGKTTKTNYNQAVNVNEMYKNASQLMQKDSLTKEDSSYLRMVDSTFKSIMKQR